MSTSNPYAPKNAVTKNTTVNNTEAQEETKLEVPSGTVSEVTDWVGTDKERAKAALAAEKTGAERKTLISHLEEVLEKE